MNLENYLKRIHCENLKEPTLENLKILQKNHLNYITFENLNIMFKIPIKMDLNLMYQKVIEKNRGGFCFELNYLFNWLLKELGYKVDLVSCRVYQQLTQIYSPWFAHVINLVHINNKRYLTDVGFSYPYQFPLQFNINEIQSDMTGLFRIEATYTNHIFTVLRCNTKQDWAPIYQFDQTPRDIIDFENMLEWVQSENNPRFYNRSFCIRLTEDGLLMLIGFKLKKLSFKESMLVNEDEVLMTKKEVMLSIKNVFNVTLEDDFEPRDLI